ncbi:hypothetical protein JL720_10205 [Aureococcus anophagefferens]|nr:hypothetical protein JL720_10205 [Aureococcus anophagefferens]
MDADGGGLVLFEEFCAFMGRLKAEHKDRHEAREARARGASASGDYAPRASGDYARPSPRADPAPPRASPAGVREPRRARGAAPRDDDDLGVADGDDDDVLQASLATTVSGGAGRRRRVPRRAAVPAPAPLAAAAAADDAPGARAAAVRAEQARARGRLRAGGGRGALAPGDVAHAIADYFPSSTGRPSTARSAAAAAPSAGPSVPFEEFLLGLPGIGVALADDDALLFEKIDPTAAASAPFAAICDFMGRYKAERQDRDEAGGGSLRGSRDSGAKLGLDGPCTATIKDGQVGITFNNGTLEILETGRHTIEKATHVLAGFVSTGQQALRIAEVTGMSLDNVELTFDAAICVRVVDASKAVMMLTSGRADADIKHEATTPAESPESGGGFRSAIHDSFMDMFRKEMINDCGIEVINMAIEDVKIVDHELAKALASAAVANSALERQTIEAEIVQVKAQADSKVASIGAEGKAAAMHIIAPKPTASKPSPTRSARRARRCSSRRRSARAAARSGTRTVLLAQDTSAPRRCSAVQGANIAPVIASAKSGRGALGRAVWCVPGDGVDLRAAGAKYGRQWRVVVRPKLQRLI